MIAQQQLEMVWISGEHRVMNVLFKIYIIDIS